MREDAYGEKKIPIAEAKTLSYRGEVLLSIKQPQKKNDLD